jgi:NADPH2:quinone reductase
MRAVVMSEPSEGPETTAVREVAVPRPAAGQVSIDVGYAGINFIDVMARRGDPGYASAWPYRPGLEVAGIVREVGPDVGLATGQRVAAFTRGGGLAEVAIAEAALVVPVPGAVSLPVAAAAPLVLSTAWLLLDHVARLRAGESVLMHSASGGVGSAVAQLVPVLGGGLSIGTVSRPDKVDAARRAGWDVALVRGDGLVEAVEGKVDVILDPVGTSLLEVDLELVKPGGRIVLFGNAGGAQLAPLPAAGRLIGGNVGLAGFSMSRLTEAAPTRVAAALRRVLGLLAEGRLDLPVTEIGSLDEVAGVQQRLAEGRGTGKYVVKARF